MAKHDTNAAGLALMLAFGLFWSAITLIADGVIVWGAVRQLIAFGYSTTQGQITRSEVKEKGAAHDKDFEARLGYRYVVGDQTYDGDRYRYGLRLSSRRATQRIVDENPVGKTVVVHYRTADPQDAVLRIGIGGDDLMVAMALFPFNLVMLGIWYAVGPSITKPVAGGARLIDDGICVRVRLATFPPLTAAAIAVAAASFVGVFIVAFGFGGDPTMPVMLVIWGVVLTIGIAVYLARQRRLNKGDFDLAIDRVSQRVTLPCKLGQSAVAVPMHRFTSAEVQRVEKSDSEGHDYYRYIPVLIFTDEAGTTHREKLVEWSSQARAKGLVDWLREQLRISASNDPFREG